MTKTPSKSSLLLITFFLLWTAPTSAQDANQPDPSEAVDKSEEPEPTEESSEAVEWDFSARLRPRAETRFNHRFGLNQSDLNYAFQPDDLDIISQQSRLGVTARRDHLSAHLTLQHSATWGVFGGNSLTVPPLGIYEARIRYAPSDLVFLDLGRFELAYGDQRVLGSVGWSQVGRTWDGIRVGLRPGDLSLDLFGARHQEPVGFVMGESYLTGAYGSLQDLVDPFLTESDLYLLADLDREREVALFLLGTRHYGEILGLDWTLEGGFQFGENCPVNDGPCGAQAASVQAYFFDIEAGYELAGLRPFLGFSMASGDDPDTETFEGYSQFYPTAHKWLGLMDIIGPRTNLREIRVGLTYAQDWFSTALAAHNFTRQSTGESAGQEFNITASALLSEGLRLQAGHGLFLPGPAISQSNQNPQGIANWSFLQLVASF